MKCVNCGKEIEENANFCPFCGVPQTGKGGGKEKAAGRDASGNNVPDEDTGNVLLLLNRNKKAVVAGIAATILFGLAMATGAYEAGNFFAVLYLAALAATCILAGTIRILKHTAAFAMAGFRLLPFPVSLITGIISLLLAMIVFFFFPAAFTLADRYELKKSIESR